MAFLFMSRCSADAIVIRLQHNVKSGAHGYQAKVMANSVVKPPITPMGIFYPIGTVFTSRMPTSEHGK